ncbi:YbhB/YbcL family Raf kinase inhibitor-like protein [Herbiconiux sp. UC225_62]|uniref:YbhB/YbcL family Raf kinase inhibitor-like protein n=1 Tax=Herbiconiux sp. UC225_62 TaxID=3350168 RepID=UPI0036D3B03E
MAGFGWLLRGARAGDGKLAWNRPELIAPATVLLTSDTFVADDALPARCAGKGVGANVSPALAWGEVPPSTQQLVFVLEDPDAPTPRPVVHTIATIIPDLTELSEGALSGERPPTGVAFYRGSLGSSGYNGPRPVPGHGPHRYAFQLFALSAHLGLDSSSSTPRSVFATMAGKVIARGRIDGTYER